MESRFWGSHKKRGRGPQEEYYNRDRHWTRTFSVRQESWPIIEHWASEMGYRLNATRGKRRLYRKSGTPNWYTTFFDVRQEENQITLSAWIEAGWVARLFWLFRIPRDLPYYPSGWPAVFIRRRRCREMNALLGRFKQAPIVGSESFHPADLDVTTLALFASFLLPVLALLSAGGIKFEWTPGLAVQLLATMGTQLGILLATGLGLLVVHHWLITKQFPAFIPRVAGAALSFVVFTVLSVVLVSQAFAEMSHKKVTFHCLHSPNSDRCRAALESASPEVKAYTLDQIRHLEKELTNR